MPRCGSGGGGRVPLAGRIIAGPPVSATTGWFFANSSARSSAARAVLRRLRAQPGERGHVRGLQRVVGRHLHVGLDADALQFVWLTGLMAPVRDERREVVVQAHEPARVRAARRRFADEVPRFRF